MMECLLSITSTEESKCIVADDVLEVDHGCRSSSALGSSFGIMCTESELTNAVISTAERCIGQIAEFTVVRDERKTPVTFGFLLEIEGKMRASLLQSSSI